MRDRLIELLKKSPHLDVLFGGDDEYAKAADDLLANGVIVLPCKVGQTVYVPWRWNGQSGIAYIEVQDLRIYDSSNHWMFFIDMESDDEDYNQSFGGWMIGECIGQTVFLTREEAEKALAEREVKE